MVLPAALPAQASIAVIPRPAHVTMGTGTFHIERGTEIRVLHAGRHIGEQLADYLEPAMGWRMPVRVGGTPSGSELVLIRDTSLYALGAEGYKLSVTSHRVTVRAPETAGLFYGLQTIRQLLPTDIFRDAPVDSTDWSMPAVTIEDQPRFRWRGAHLDVVRHFMPKEFVKKYIDLLALHKMNSFHWHLTDDQGWRIEIKKYPKLTEVGAWRKETMVPPYPRNRAEMKFDSTPTGGFYSQDDIREIVAYAADRHINVVPEIEMPGHAVAAIAAYPELGLTGDTTTVATYWGVFSNILNPTDATVKFFQDVLTEVMELFPSKFIHVGGDEADKDLWKASPVIQARIKALGLKNEAELQSWFIQQMDKFLTAHGRRLIGWDEILEGGLAPGATVMSWRGVAGGIAAARAGHDVVMAPTSHTYLDYYQSRDTQHEPIAIGGFLPMDTVYAFDPYPDSLEARYRKHILGAQVQLWTEYIPTPKQAEYMAYPRTSAFSEVVWTPEDERDYSDFLRRLKVHEKRLEALDVNYRADGADGADGADR
ncbi:MAG TPA: beta-N-acetylhexosaminidase [Gemmatimonadales bacterium]|nr:beta-N-acetylhexosaminidase [Gemmatimonadales bacterium]